MKKLILSLLLLLCGCNDMHLIEKQEEISKTKHLDTVSSMNELIKNINKNIKNKQMTYEFQCTENFPLKDIVKRLSFLIPYDIKVIKSKQENYQRIEIICLDDEFDKSVEEASRIIKEIIHEDMNNSEKIDAIYQYILAICDYDTSIQERTKDNERAFLCSGVLFDRNAVCTGYARTFLLFMNLLDIPALYIPSDVMNHSFNLVYNKNMNYYDLTWDDETGLYYGKNKQEFFQDKRHVFDPYFDDVFFEGFLTAIYL